MCVWRLNRGSGGVCKRQRLVSHRVKVIFLKVVFSAQGPVQLPFDLIFNCHIKFFFNSLLFFILNFILNFIFNSVIISFFYAFYYSALIQLYNPASQGNLSVQFI